MAAADFDSYVVAILVNGILETMKDPTPKQAVDLYEAVLTEMEARPSRV